MSMDQEPSGEKGDSQQFTDYNAMYTEQHPDAITDIPKAEYVAHNVNQLETAAAQEGQKEQVVKGMNDAYFAEHPGEFSSQKIKGIDEVNSRNRVGAEIDAANATLQSEVDYDKLHPQVDKDSDPK